MSISIGIFTAMQSLNNIRSADQEMKKHAKITYLPYTTFSELANLYEKNILKFDGILFSGPFPRDYIKENISSITKPCRCIDIKDRDFYLAVARIYARNPAIDFTRVYLDAGLDEKLIQNVFPAGKGPISSSATPLEYRGLLRSSIYANSLEKYKNLWTSHTCDLFMVRLTNLADRLEAEHIPHYLLVPSRQSILECFYELMEDIRQSVLQNSLVACCIVETSEEYQTFENCQKLHGALETFAATRRKNLLIRKNGTHFEITTSSSEARELTDGCTACLLSEALERTISFPLFLGWGLGFDIVSAYKNAKRALQACQKDRNHYTYLVTEDQEMVGPLNSNRSLSYDLHPDAQINALAKTLGIAPVNLEKMVSLQKFRHMYEFTSSDLVYFLEITPRSASRILLKLSENGLARPVRSINLSKTGRPATVYEIDFGTMVP